MKIHKNQWLNIKNVIYFTDNLRGQLKLSICQNDWFLLIILKQKAVLPFSVTWIGWKVGQRGT